MDSDQHSAPNKMRSRIEQIQKLAYELKDLGQGIPVVEKNAQDLLSTAYVLKFGISDVAEMETF